MTLTLAELARRIDATLTGDGSVQVHACASLETAAAGEVSFLANPKYQRFLRSTHASAVILSPADLPLARGLHLNILTADDPYFAFREAVVLLHGYRPQPAPGISPLAFVHPTATLGEGCHIGPFASIAEHAVLGKGCIVHSHTSIGAHTVLGEACILYPHVTLYDHITLGSRVIVHSGTVIGQDGYGFATHKGAHHKIPHPGTVVIEDDVELGANCCINRAAVGQTRIGAGTKIGSLVEIGHGVSIGRHNLIVAQTGIAGSTSTGDYVVMGGQTGIAGHLTIAPGTQIAAKSGVKESIPVAGQYGGIPAMPLTAAKRLVLALARLPEILTTVRDLKKRMDELEKK